MGNHQGTAEPLPAPSAVPVLPVPGLTGWGAAAGSEQRELARAPAARTGGFFQRCWQEGNAVAAWKMSAKDKGSEGEVRFR